MIYFLVDFLQIVVVLFPERSLSFLHVGLRHSRESFWWRSAKMSSVWTSFLSHSMTRNFLLLSSIFNVGARLNDFGRSLSFGILSLRMKSLALKSLVHGWMLLLLRFFLMRTLIFSKSFVMSDSWRFLIGFRAGSLVMPLLKLCCMSVIRCSRKLFLIRFS